MFKLVQYILETTIPCYSLHYRQNETLVKSVYKTAPKFWLGAPNCVQGFEKAL